MAFELDAIAYYAFHVTSLPLSLLLFIIYRNHKHHSIIAYFALTLFFSSINSCYLAFANNGDIRNTANTLACDIQAFFISYLNSSAAVWPVCIESNMTLILLRRRRQQQGKWSRKQILLTFMAFAWILPLFFSGIAFALAVSEKGLKPWLYYCMFSEPAIGPAIGIYFVSLCAVMATIIMSAWNVKLVCDESEDVELSKRVIAFGIIIALPVCLSTLARSFNVLIYNSVDNNGTWPDFLLVTVPYFSFILFGTVPQLIKQILPSSTPCQRNRGDSLLLRFSIVNPTLRTDPMDERMSLTLAAATEKSSWEMPTSRSSTPGPSTFSQRTDPNAPDPFSHRKNPSLTINVNRNNNNNNNNNNHSNRNHNNRISKGKNPRTSVSIRQSFLARALSVNKKSENSVAESSHVNSGSLQKGMRFINSNKNNRRRSNRFSGMMYNNRRSRRSILFDMVNEKPRYFKKFSFEYRKRTESVIGIPPEYVVFDDPDVNDIPEIPDELKMQNKLISRDKYIPPSIEVTRNFTQASSYNSIDYEGMIEENEKNEKESRERLARKELSRYPRPPPLALSQNKSKSTSPSFFFLTPDHYDNNNDEYTDLPVTPSFGVSSPSENHDASSSLSSKSNNSNHSNHSNHSVNSSKSSHRGGLRLTPRNSIPVHILNRKSLLDALPSMPSAYKEYNYNI